LFITLPLFFKKQVNNINHRLFSISIHQQAKPKHMEKLLQELDSIVDLSHSETEQIIHAFKQFVDRNFSADPKALDYVFKTRGKFVLNQQEDEDNLHAHYGEFIYSYAS
jgi:hypothetical protein